MAQKRPHVVHTRVSEDGKTWIDQMAAETDSKDAEVVRAALAVARHHEIETKRILNEDRRF